jgi:nicotinamide-nucleotide amidase
MKLIKAAVITIGDELLIGQTIDTNSAWIGTELNRVGIWVHRRVAVGDDREAIIRALDEESRQADIILITGGLGPTSDDITKPVLSDYFGGRLVEDAGVLARLEAMMASRGSTVGERLRKQALVPDCASVLENDWGTAPGMWFEKNGKVYASMPGVPHEMQGLMLERVIPRLREMFPLPVILHRTIETIGLGETAIAERLSGLEQSLPSHITLAYLPGNGILKLRLTARGETAQQTAAELEQHFTVMKNLLADILVTDEDVPLEAWIGNLLRGTGKTLATAESCTGGYIASRITSVEGSSEYYKGSVVSYSNEVKKAVLGVSPDTLRQHGAVSEQTAKQMAAGILKLLGTDYAVATTGIMGPGGGTPEKPVGTVWVAVASAGQTVTRRFQLRYSRSRNTEITANNAFNMLRQLVLDERQGG